MLQQGAFPRGADAWHIIKRGGANGFGAFGAVRTDGETVRLVAQALDEIQYGIGARQGENPLAGAIEFFFASVTIFALGNPDEGNVGDAQFGHNLGHGGNLSGPTVNQQQIRPVAAFAFRVFGLQAPSASSSVRTSAQPHPSARTASRNATRAGLNLKCSATDRCFPKK